MNTNTLWGRVGPTLAQTVTLAFARLLLLLTLASLTLWSGAASATATTTTLSVSATSVGTNQAITLTATVSPNTAVGYVSFLDGGSNLGSVTVSNGVAVLSKAFYTTGAHNLTAVFSATTGAYTGSTSDTVVETVGNPVTSTSTSLAINPTTVTTGQFFTLTATVSPSAAPGYIAFMDGSNTLGTVNLNNGVATLSKSLSVTGAHNITAVYNAGSSAYSNSTSATVVETVNNPVTTTTTSLSSSATSVAVGQSFTLTGTVSPSSATGYIAFMDGSNTLSAVTVSNGVATLSKALYDVGNHSITAVFNASSSAYTNSTSATVVETVGSSGTPTATVTSLSASPSSAATGQSVTLTASVNPGTGTGTVTGSVIFKDGSTTLGTGTLSAGVATLSTSFTTTGTHSLTAVYGGATGSPGYAASTSAAVNETITAPAPTATATTLTTSSSTVNVGQTVVLTATLSPTAATGSVSFMDGSTTLGTGTLSAGVATLSTSFTTTGAHSLTAVYAGTASYAASTSAAVTETVNAAATATSTTLVTSSSTVTVGQSVTLTASVTPTGTATTSPTGTVTFKDGSTTLGTGTLNGTTATLSTSFTATGTHSLTAVYGGDSNNLTSTSTAVSQTVNSAMRPTSTSLSASTSTVSVGQSLTLTASVTATGTATTSPTGTVTFKDGGTTIGTGTLTAGSANVSVSFTATGTHVLTAVYGGDSANLGSTSPVLNTVVMSPAAPLPAPPNSSAPVVGFSYDAQNQPTRVTQAPGVAGFNLATSTAYDALGRPKTVTDPQAGTTQLSYDGLGRVTTVIDPRSLSTQYPRDGLGQATQLQSPDTGSANLGYDVAGNLSTRTDSRGVLAGYTYDAINRLTGVAFSLASQTQVYTWTYDQTGGTFTNGKGRLTTASFPEGSTSYAYDPQGRVTQVRQVISAAANTNPQAVVQYTSYAYDAAGHVTSLVYPSGRMLNISYTGGLPTTLALAQNAIATAVPLLSNIQYAPFGAAQAWNWNMTGSSANNPSAGPHPYARSFDTSGRVTRYPLVTPLGNTLRDLSYDPASRITAYTHYQAAVGASSGIALPSLDQQFSYDANGRLTQATVANPAAVTTWAYSYDANGNRTSVAVNGNTPGAYTIDAASNRITAISTPPVSLSYDAAGNTLSDGTYTLGYNLRGRLSSVSVNGNVTTYSHDNAGNRVRKFSNSGANSTQLFVYDQAGHLLGEYDQTGAPIREYIWLDDQPVAVFMPDPAAGSNPQNAAPLIYYVYADHLNTPRAVVDTAGNLRWSWVDEPFGTTAANSNPTGQGTFIFSLRFPGQFYDAESGMHYNVNRDYVPGVGRYAQSDPVGLDGGINTYAYVKGNPVIATDAFGLFIQMPLGPKYRDLQFSDPALPPVDDPCVMKYLYDTYGGLGGFLTNIGNPQQYFPGNNPNWEHTDKEAAEIVAEKMAVTKGPVAAGNRIASLAPTGSLLGAAGRGLAWLGGLASGVVEVAGAGMTPFAALAMENARRQCSCQK